MSNIKGVATLNILWRQIAITREASSDGIHVEGFLHLLQKHGKAALRLTLAGVGGRLPRSNLVFLAELLLALSRRLPNETRLWLKESFAEVGTAAADYWQKIDVLFL